MAPTLMAAGAAANQAASTPSPITGVIESIRRSRSKSELRVKHIFGVVSGLVGPALPSASPASSASPQSPGQVSSQISPGKLVKKFTFGEETQKRGNADVQRLLSPQDAHRAPEDDNDMEDGDLSPLSARTPGGTRMQPTKLEIIPTLDGFAENVRTLAPGLSQKLVDRIAHEQVKRFKKLVDHRHKHIVALQASGQCSNGTKCRRVFGAIGVGSDGFVGVTGHKRGIQNVDDGLSLSSYVATRLCDTCTDSRIQTLRTMILTIQVPQMDPEMLLPHNSRSAYLPRPSRNFPTRLNVLFASKQKSLTNHRTGPSTSMKMFSHSPAHFLTAVSPNHSSERRTGYDTKTKDIGILSGGRATSLTVRTCATARTTLCSTSCVSTRCGSLKSKPRRTAAVVPRLSWFGP